MGMAVIKCKMCGGDLELTEGMTVAECEYCGTQQTVPSVDNEKKLTLFARANRLRSACEFDKAAGVYESIVAEFPEEAEAYWGLVLCRYGIEYVDDPATGKKIPTCHRSSFDSIFEDSDFEQACENADVAARKVYREEAKVIEDLRKGILEVSGKEEPYDIFICYKETDEEGERTVDSVIAQDVYEALTENGYRVFFSRITLEDKLGTEYEPYIFAALNSAKIMLAFGTDYERFNAVWVKNEWSRFLSLMAAGQKKVLIPCYKGIDAYDMPKEFAKLQAQDMGKVGAMQDLLRGIEKIMENGSQAAPAKETVVVQQGGGPTVESLLRRGELFLEDGDWDQADTYFDKVLDIDPECGEAFFGKYLAREKQNSLQAFVRWRTEVSFQNLSEERKEACQKDNARIQKAVENYRVDCYLGKERIQREFDFDRSYPSYSAAAWERVKGEGSLWEQDKLLSRALQYADPDFAKQMENARREILTAVTQKAEEIQRQENQQAEEIQQRYVQHLDAAEQGAAKLHEEARARQEWDAAQAKAQAEEERKRAELAKMRARRNKKIGIVVAIVAVVGAAVFALLKFVILPANHYKNAEALLANGNYDGAAAAFEALGDYHDSAERIPEVRYQEAEKLLAAGDYDGAATAFMAAGDYKDSAERIPELRYQEAEELVAEGDPTRAAIRFWGIGDYKDARERSFALWEDITVRNSLAAGDSHTVGLRADGTVVAMGNNNLGQCDVADWSDIVAVSTGRAHTVGLQADGTVAAVGNNNLGQCNVFNWNNIIAVSAGPYHTVGLRAGGTVVAVGNKTSGQCEVSGWKDIITVSAGLYHTVGLRGDGTVAAVGDSENDQCDVSGWNNIVAVSAGSLHTVGLRSDGTVVAVGDNRYGQCNVSDWSDIVAVSAGGAHTVGLRADGTVVAVGDNEYGQCNVSGWSDIVTISAGKDHTVGLRADGTVVATGDNINGECNVSGWTNIKTPERSAEHE